VQPKLFFGWYCLPDIFDYVGMFSNPEQSYNHLGGVRPDAFDAASKRTISHSDEYQE
jgi:hypothetical protein